MVPWTCTAAGADRLEGVGNGQTTVVMHMDAQLGLIGRGCAHRRNGRGDLKVGSAAAIGIAQDRALGAGVDGRLHRLQRVVMGLAA